MCVCKQWTIFYFKCHKPFPLPSEWGYFIFILFYFFKFFVFGGWVVFCLVFLGVFFVVAYLFLIYKLTILLILLINFLKE